MLEFTAVSPSGHLRSIVQRFILSEAVIPAGLQWTHLLAPSMSEIIYFNLNDTPQVFILTDGTELTLNDGVFGGQFTGSFHARFSGHVRLIGVHIHSSGLYKIFKVPVRLTTGHPILLEDVLGPQAARLSQQLRELDSLQKVIMCLEEFLTRMILKNKVDPHPLVEGTFSSIGHSNGKMPISEIAADLKTSERNLQMLFLEQVGVSPKMYSRLYRFNEVIRTMNNNTFSWKFAVEKLGYYDQAHFINDFKSISGLGPSQYFSGHSMVNRFFTEF